MDILYKSIENYQKKNNKKIKESTINLYVKNIERLFKFYNKDKNKELNDIINFLLKNNKEILSNSGFFKNKSNNTKKLYLTSIIISLKANDKEDDEIYKKYYNLMMELNNINEKIKEKQIKSETQKINWLKYNKLISIYKYYKKLVLVNKIRKKKEFDKKLYEILQSYLILTLYLGSKNNLPRRLEYSEMSIENIKKLKMDPDTHPKYFLEKYNNNKLLIKNSREMWFIFVNYKTNRTYGPQIVKVSKPLLSAINLYRKFYKDRKYLLTNYNGTNINKNQLTKKLNQIFIKKVNKKISVSMIRNIVMTELFSNIPQYKNIEDATNQMATSVLTALKTYNKKD